MVWNPEDKYNSDPEELDWTEEDWELFFQEQDRRAEPNQKKFIETNQLYSEEYSSDHEFSKRIQSQLNLDSSEINSHWLELSSDPYDELENSGSNNWKFFEETPLEAFPVYQYSYNFSLETPHFVKYFYDQGIDTPEIHQLHFHCYQIAAHVAAGHVLGYGKDGLTGNIAKLKRALKSANLCLEALFAIKRKKLTDNQSVEKLIQDNIFLRDVLIHHIEELRHEVWW